MMPAAEARDLLRGQFEVMFPGVELPWPALRILMAQTRQEGSWGDFGGVDCNGTPWGHNWGAVQAPGSAPCPVGTFAAKDSKPTSHGQVYFSQCFKGYVDDTAGIRDYLHHALELRHACMGPLLRGDVWGYAREAHRLGYYGGFSTTTGEGPAKDAARTWEQVESYVDMLDKQGAEVDRALGLPVAPPTRKPKKPSLTFKGSGSKLTDNTTLARPAAFPWGLLVSAIALPLIVWQSK